MIGFQLRQARTCRPCSEGLAFLVATATSRVTGRSIPYTQIPVGTIRQQNAKVARASEFLNAVGYTTDFEALRKRHPGLMNLDTWLIKEGKAKIGRLAIEK